MIRKNGLLGVGLIAAALVLGLATPASAGETATHSLRHAGAVFEGNGGFVTIDGYTWRGTDGSGRHGALEVFMNGYECFQEQPGFRFSGWQLTWAKVSGSQVMDCYTSEGRHTTATVVSDVKWKRAGATGRETVTDGDRTSRHARVPADITGTVTVTFAGRQPVVLTHQESSYDTFRSEWTRSPVG